MMFAGIATCSSFPYRELGFVDWRACMIPYGPEILFVAHSIGSNRQECKGLHHVCSPPLALTLNPAVCVQDGEIGALLRCRASGAQRSIA